MLDRANRIQEPLMARTTKTSNAASSNISKEPHTPAPEIAPDMPLPHERDQASGQAAVQPDPVIAQALRDIDAGLVDTDMRVTPGLDAARREALVPSVGPSQEPAAPVADKKAAAPRRP